MQGNNKSNIKQCCGILKAKESVTERSVVQMPGSVWEMSAWNKNEIPPRLLPLKCP